MLNEWYATKIAREWNVPHVGVGYVMAFDVDAAYLERFAVPQVGGRDVLELWVPAEQLEQCRRDLVEVVRRREAPPRQIAADLGTSGDVVNLVASSQR